MKKIDYRNEYVVYVKGEAVFSFSSVTIENIYSLVRIFATREMSDADISSTKFRYRDDVRDGAYDVYLNDELVSSITLSSIIYYDYKGETYYDYASRFTEDEPPAPDLTYDGLVIEFDDVLLKHNHLFEDDARKVKEYFDRFLES